MMGLVARPSEDNHVGMKWLPHDDIIIRRNARESLSFSLPLPLPPSIHSFLPSSLSAMKVCSKKLAGWLHATESSLTRNWTFFLTPWPWMSSLWNHEDASWWHHAFHVILLWLLELTNTVLRGDILHREREVSVQTWGWNQIVVENERQNRRMNGGKFQDREKD